ncbi:ubiquinol-cytochrome-c reductase [Pichia membranifaciens]|uniref:Cytochrome b-c1 complex subunit 8 n=1 Tax=Pichia membranifaciens TaxID=4926 RepID=A0A1Q2YGB3_9ASCO|nr:ubiquinol-cytochrome-c reductase [Pichia membranifaciens]
MSLVKLDMNFWSIVDKQYFDFMSQKKRIFNNYDKEKLKEHPFYRTLDTKEATEAFIELRDFVVDHFTHRFPKLFTKKGNIVFNHLLNETYDLDEVDPLVVVTRMSMEDYYVTILDPETEERTCVGASAAFAGGGFPIAPIVGQGMDAIHGPVPYYESKLKKSMNKWFERFTDPVERASIHIVWDRDLASSELYSKQRELSEAGILTSQPSSSFFRTGSPKQKRITIHSVSPYAQAPLHGSVDRAIFNSFRRFKSQVLYIAIPFAIVWSVWTDARDYNEYLYTKAGREELERVNV